MNPLLQEIYSTIIPSAPYIIVAYALVWLLLGVWLFAQYRKQNALAKQLMLLEEAMEDAAKRAAQ
ncbi:MAG: CcmD family protein [Eggerthellales bacterium]|nr:CcmD family protein [Eggerthellales bacterium]